MAHRIVDADETIVYLDGNVVMVWIAPATGRPVPLLTSSALHARDRLPG